MMHSTGERKQNVDSALAPLFFLSVSISFLYVSFFIVYVDVRLDLIMLLLMLFASLLLGFLFCCFSGMLAGKILLLAASALAFPRLRIRGM